MFRRTFLKSISSIVLGTYLSCHVKALEIVEKVKETKELLIDTSLYNKLPLYLAKNEITIKPYKAWAKLMEKKDNSF